MKRVFVKYWVFLFITILIGFQGFAKDFPASVKDGRGQTVTIKKQPQKIISLGAASTEILYAVGAEKQIAAVSDVSNFPEEAKSLPKIGGFDAKTISLEKILSYKPDLIIIYSGMHDFLIPSLERFHIPIYVSNDEKIVDVIKEIKDIAILSGHIKNGEKLANQYNQILRELKKVTDCFGENKPKIFWEVYNNPYMSAGKNSFINDVISLSGGKNICGNIEQSYPIISEETIIASNPDFILIPSDMYSSVDSVANRRGWQTIGAVKNNRIIIFDADSFTRPGPRIFDAIKELNGYLKNSF